MARPVDGGVSILLAAVATLLPACCLSRVEPAGSEASVASSPECTSVPPIRVEVAANQAAVLHRIEVALRRGRLAHSQGKVEEARAAFEEAFVCGCSYWMALGEKRFAEYGEAAERELLALDGGSPATSRKGVFAGSRSTTDAIWAYWYGHSSVTGFAEEGLAVDPLDTVCRYLLVSVRRKLTYDRPSMVRIGDVLDYYRVRSDEDRPLVSPAGGRVRLSVWHPAGPVYRIRAEWQRRERGNGSPSPG